MDSNSLQKAVDICDEIKQLLESLKEKKATLEFENNIELSVEHTIKNENVQTSEDIKIDFKEKDSTKQNNIIETTPAGLVNNRQNNSHVKWIHSLRSIGNYIRPNNY